VPARPFIYLWTLPTTAIGLVVIALDIVFGNRVRTRVVAGVIEAHGGLVTWLLTHCTLLQGGASAMTLGHVVLGRDAISLDLSREHERVHVRQCERWGPLFIPAYLVGSAIAFFRTGRAYRDNPFEREAYGDTATGTGG
jgi:hypothetical protein